jgi:hypothetical protein
MATNETDDSPGWEAITDACTRIYGEQEPRHYGTVVKYAWGGRDPLDGVSIYTSDAGLPHWHYVSYGLTELYRKQSPNEAESGWGFELTFRLRRDAGEPPTWPISLMQNLARYVFQSGNVFDNHHYINLNSPICVGAATDLRAALFVIDPQLGVIETPHGVVRFLQIVGLTLDEMNAIAGWNAEGFLAVLRRDNDLLVTDLDRLSILTDTEQAAAIQEGTARDGSSTSIGYSPGVAWQVTQNQVQVRLGANAVPDLLRALRGRLLHDRDFILHGDNQYVTLRPGEQNAWNFDSETLTLTLTPALCREMCDGVQPRRGTYTWLAFPELLLEIVPTEIKDADGKVIEVVG